MLLGEPGHGAPVRVQDSETQTGSHVGLDAAGEELELVAVLRHLQARSRAGPAGLVAAVPSAVSVGGAVARRVGPSDALRPDGTAQDYCSGSQGAKACDEGGHADECVHGVLLIRVWTQEQESPRALSAHCPRSVAPRRCQEMSS